MKNNKEYIEYHVFTDEQDEWFRDKHMAMKLYESWVAQYGDVRLYEERRAADGELLDETCIMSHGEWPR